MYILLRFYPSSFLSFCNTHKNHHQQQSTCFTFFSVVWQQPKNVSTTPNFYFLNFYRCVCVCAPFQFFSIIFIFQCIQMSPECSVDRKYGCSLLQLMCVCLHMFALRCLHFCEKKSCETGNEYYTKSERGA